MPGGESRTRDARGVGFATRAPLAQALAWVDAHAAPLPEETVAVDGAVGRVLAVDVTATGDLPVRDVAMRDGLAVAAEATLGADAYSPMPLMPGAFTAVSAGEAMPPGTDSVLPVEATGEMAGFAQALAPVAPGDGVERRGEGARAGAVVLTAGRALGAGDAGFLCALGIAEVAVVRRPRVRIVLAGGPRSGPEALGAMLGALAMRDGGLVERIGPLPADRAGLAAALAAPGRDLVVMAGRTGVGVDDVAPLALADAGILAVHGLALRPGDTGGLGLVGGAPAVLLPGEPMAALAVWDLLAGRALRRLAGRGDAPPHATITVALARKLVSEIGMTELYRVRLTPDGRAEPVASAVVPGLGGMVRADGFVLLAEGGEGVPAGAPVTVHLYG